MPHLVSFGLLSPKSNPLSHFAVQKAQCDVCGKKYAKWEEAELCELSHTVNDFFKRKEVTPCVVCHTTQKDR